MKLVIITGALIGQLANFTAVFMDDKRALGIESEAVHMQDGLLDNIGGSEGEESADEKDLVGKATFFELITPASVVYVMFVADLIGSLGAGMTVKFFPVFFQQECHVSPATVNVVFGVLGGLTALAQFLAQKASKRYGRLQVIIPLVFL